MLSDIKEITELAMSRKVIDKKKLKSTSKEDVPINTSTKDNGGSVTEHNDLPRQTRSQRKKIF